MQMRVVFCLVVIVGLMSCAGCGGYAPVEPKDLKAKMVDVIPLTGKIVFDGSVPTQLVVSAFKEQSLGDFKALDPAPTLNSPIKGTISARLKPDGSFFFTTYQPGDGLSAGNWILLFCKGGKEFENFNSKNNNPTTSTHKVTLEKGKPVDLGEIKLSKDS